MLTKLRNPVATSAAAGIVIATPQPSDIMIPVELKSRAWRLEEPPAPALENFPPCVHEKKYEQPRCDYSCMLPERVGRGPSRRFVLNRTRACERCSCQLCAICSKPANRYTSPSGQEIEAVVTQTEPRFTFAYNPYDDDMSRMRKSMILEPTLTHAWYEATAQCCNQSKGLVIDVGGNFGWYTLYSLALGCSVVVFEPVPAYQEVLRLGVALNPGFAARTTLYGNVVYDTPGKYTLRVPFAKRSGRMKKLGMTGMDGSAGILKADWKAESYNHVASSVRIDEILDSHPLRNNVCMLKADVEGYEPQVLQTARRLLKERKVPAIQLELTRTPGVKGRNQTCAAVKALAHLADLGFDFKQVRNKIIDDPAPPVGTWKTARSPWASLPSFPSAHAVESSTHLFKLGLAGTLFGRSAVESSRNAAMQMAYRKDFQSFSTNLIALHRPEKACGRDKDASGTLRKADGARRCPHWPALHC